MKKSLIILIVGIAFISSISHAQSTVSSANIVGYAQRELPPGGKLLIGVNFTANGKNPTLKELIGNNQLHAATNPSESDQVMIWDPEKSRYQAYALHSRDKQFYPCTSKQWLSSAPVNPAVPTGSGFWIVSAAGSTTAKTIYISGDVTDAPLPVNFDPELQSQLIANPFPAEASIAVLTERFRPNPGDTASVWNDGQYTNYRFSGNGSWVPAGNTAAIGTNDKIRPGESFWFIRSSTRTKNAS